jgi:transposase-like protein
MNEKGSSSGNRWTLEERKRILSNFAVSGLSAWAYAQKVGITGATFYKWLAKSKESDKNESVKFAKAEIGGVVFNATDSVVLENGLKVCVSPGTSITRVIELVENLRRL